MRTSPTFTVHEAVAMPWDRSITGTVRAVRGNEVKVRFRADLKVSKIEGGTEPYGVPKDDELEWTPAHWYAKA